MDDSKGACPCSRFFERQWLPMDERYGMASIKGHRGFSVWRLLRAVFARSCSVRLYWGRGSVVLAGRRQTERGTRVLLCERDSCDATIYAPCFASALYRQALALGVYILPDFGTDDTRGFLRLWARSLSVIFPPEWCQTLEDIAGRPVSQWTQGRMVNQCLINPYELRVIERRDLQFAEMDQEIPWSNLI